MNTPAESAVQTAERSVWLGGGEGEGTREQGKNGGNKDRAEARA